MAERQTLKISGHVTLDASGAGTVTLGPSKAPGPSNWLVTGVIVQTSRPGLAPIPKFQAYRESAEPANSLGLSYDGSYTQGRCREVFTRGQQLVSAWTGGQSGDTAYVTLTGEKW